MEKADVDLLNQILALTRSEKVKWKEDIEDNSFSVTLKDRYAVQTWQNSHFDVFVKITRSDGVELFSFTEPIDEPRSEIFSVFSAAKESALGIEKAREDIRKLLTEL